MSSAVPTSPASKPTMNHSGRVSYFLSIHQPIKVGTPIIHGIASARPAVVMAWRQVMFPLFFSRREGSLGLVGRAGSFESEWLFSWEDIHHRGGGAG